MDPPACGSRRQAGFTLVELVMVIVITGTLAVFVMPRALDLTDWRLRAFGDELAAQSRALNRMALVQRRPITATFTGSGAAFAYASGEAILSLPCPASASPCIAEGGTRSVTFNAGNSGSAVTSSGSALPITVAHGDSTRSYRIEAETGLFRAVP